MPSTKRIFTDASYFEFQNTLGVAGGSWTQQSVTGAHNGIVNRSTTIGEKVKITWSGRSLFLYVNQDATGCDFTWTTDGVARPFGNTCLRQNDPINGLNSGFTKVLIPLERDLADTTHTTILTSVAPSVPWGSNSSMVNFYINGAVAVSGAKVVGSPNQYTAFGTSWSNGLGSISRSNSFVAILHRRLAHILKNPNLALTNNGVSGSSMVGKPNVSFFTGWENLLNQGNNGATAPGIMTWEFGVNDLRSGGAGCTGGQFLENLQYQLMFVEDVFDTNTIRFAVGTPGYLPPMHLAQETMTANDGTIFNPLIGTQMGWGGYETAVAGVRQMKTLFPWVRTANIFAAMDRRDELLMVNSADATGIHPSDDCHALLAETFLKALLAA